MCHVLIDVQCELIRARRAEDPAPVEVSEIEVTETEHNTLGQ
jgi:hypothetical protein